MSQIFTDSEGRETIEQLSRFTSKYHILPNGCWQWTAAKSQGYGLYSVGQKRMKAHQYSYALSGRLVPEGMEIDHLCRNRACINPKHLEAVTHWENLLRAAPYIRPDTCTRGHDMTDPANIKHTFSKTRNKIQRQCRACKRITNLRYWHRAHAALEDNNG